MGVQRVRCFVPVKPATLMSTSCFFRLIGTSILNIRGWLFRSSPCNLYSYNCVSFYRYSCFLSPVLISLFNPSGFSPSAVNGKHILFYIFVRRYQYPPLLFRFLVQLHTLSCFWSRTAYNKERFLKGIYPENQNYCKLYCKLASSSSPSLKSLREGEILVRFLG